MSNGASEKCGALPLHHLALRTRQVEALAGFYKGVLGLEEVRADSPRSVWLGLADGAVLMIEARGRDEPDVPTGSLELFAFRVSETRKLEIRTAAVRHGCFDGETAYTIYLRDPDGRRVGASTHPLDA
jgi:glyoxylase I family protein